MIKTSCHQKMYKKFISLFCFTNMIIIFFMFSPAIRLLHQQHVYSGSYFFYTSSSSNISFDLLTSFYFCFLAIFTWRTQHSTALQHIPRTYARSIGAIFDWTRMNSTDKFIDRLKETKRFNEILQSLDGNECGNIFCNFYFDPFK